MQRSSRFQQYCPRKESFPLTGAKMGIGREDTSIFELVIVKVSMLTKWLAVTTTTEWSSTANNLTVIQLKISYDSTPKRDKESSTDVIPESEIATT